MACKCASLARVLGAFRTTQPCRSYRTFKPVIDPKYGSLEPVEKPVEKERERPPRERKTVVSMRRRDGRRHSIDYLEGFEQRRSFGVRGQKYLRPFAVDIFVSHRYVKGTIMHRTVHNAIAQATSNSKEMKKMLKCSPCSVDACRLVGRTLAARAREADCYAVVYKPRKNERLEGKLMTVLEELANCGISIYHDEKGLLLTKE